MTCFETKHRWDGEGEQAVASAGRCLRPNGGLAMFSPCIEQVQRTRGALAAAGFWDVRVFECLLREHEVRAERMVADLDANPGGINPAAPGGWCWEEAHESA